MDLLGGAVSELFGDIFGEFYLDGTLHRQIPAQYEPGGTLVPSTGLRVDVAVKVQLDAATEAMRQSEGFTDRDMAIFVLAAPLDGVITSDDEITVKGQRYMIASITQDPAGCYWLLRGRRS